MRSIDGDAFDAVLASAEAKARNQRKYVLQGAINMIRGNLKRMPTIEPERKRGRWIHNDSPDYVCKWMCSECDSSAYEPTNYCPDCGSYNGGDEK